MNELRLRELMSESANEVEASDTLRARVTAAVGGGRQRRRTTVRGWIAVGGAGLAAAAVLLAIPLIRTPESAPPGPGVSVTAPSSTGATPVDDIGEVLGNKTWYVIGIIADGSSLVVERPGQADQTMRIQVKGTGLEGFDGCHWIGANPALLDSVPVARVGMSVTANGCMPDPVGSKEFYSALSSGPKTWSRDGDVVVLTAAGIEISFSTNRYTRPSSSTGATLVDDIGEVLGNRKWYVIGIVAHGSSLVLDPPPAQAVDVMHIQLTGSILQGGDGCNALGSDPALLTSAPTVRVGFSSTAMLCSPVPTGQHEFLEALRTGPKTWSRDGDFVVLTAAGIEVSFSTNQYTRPSSRSTLRPSQPDVVQLLGTKTWYVSQILVNGAPVRLSPQSDGAMQIKVDGNSLTGFEGCNWIGANLAALSSAPATRADWSSTDVGCTPIPSGQVQFLAALRADDKSWSERDGELVLRAGVYEITFKSTPATSAVLSSQADVVNLFGLQTWYVTGVLSGGEPVQVYRPADPEMGLWLRVRTTTVTVNDSCNFLDAPARALMSKTTGQYQWGTTDVLCPARPGQAQFVSAVTANTKSWFASGDVVVLQAGGYVITFSTTTPPPSAATSTTG